MTPENRGQFSVTSINENDAILHLGIYLKALSDADGLRARNINVEAMLGFIFRKYCETLGGEAA